MIEIINDSNRAATFSYNTEEGWIGKRWFSGHTVTLAAFDEKTKRFGFLNSGADKPKIPNKLTLKSLAQMEAYINDPIGLWDKNFLVISKEP